MVSLKSTRMRHMTSRRKIFSFLIAPVLLPLAACSDSEAELQTPVSTDAVVLAKVMHLDPKPVAVKWSDRMMAKDEIFGPSDRALYALLAYSAADFESVSARLTAGQELQPVHVDSLPPWLVEQTGIDSFKTSAGYDFTGRALSAEAYLQSPYLDGFAVTIGSSRSVLVCGFTR